MKTRIFSMFLAVVFLFLCSGCTDDKGLSSSSAPPNLSEKTSHNEPENTVLESSDSSIPQSSIPESSPEDTHNTQHNSDLMDAKIEYLDLNPGRFDNFILGSSHASSYDPKFLSSNLYRETYNCFLEDSSELANMAAYLLDKHRPKQIILSVNLYDAIDISPKFTDDKPESSQSSEVQSQSQFSDIQNAIDMLSDFSQSIELPKAFGEFKLDSGCYDRSELDVEPIHNLEEYSQANGQAFPQGNGDQKLSRSDDLIETVREIRQLCEDSQVEFTLIFSPASQSQLSNFSPGELAAFLTKLADETPFWNFSVSPISYDPRFFYDSLHMRNDTGNMVLSKTFGDTRSYIPANFGSYTTPDNVLDFCSRLPDSFSTNITAPNPGIDVPVLMYHHLETDPAKINSYSVSPETFRAQMKFLLDQGYNPVSLQVLIDHVYEGKALPERPVCITFDDGYSSVYEHAFPVLRELSIPATIFIVGDSFGTSSYKDTGKKIIPHFGETEAREMDASGLVSIQSHTFDWHQSTALDSGALVRPSVKAFSGEQPGKYNYEFALDCQKINSLLESIGLPKADQFAFPIGITETAAFVVQKEEGIKLTVTTNFRQANNLVPGLPQSLLCLGRLNVTNDMSEEALLSYLNREPQ